VPDRAGGVLHVIGRLNVGGPARLVRELARSDRVAGERHAVATGAVQDGEVELPDLAGIELHRIAGLGRRVSPADDARALAALTGLCRASSPRVVHTHTAKGGALGRVAAELARAPVRVHTFHGHLLHGYFGARATAAVVTAERALARRTTRLVAVGEQVRDDLLSAGVGRPEQYDVVVPGVALPPVPDRREARRRLGLPDDDRPVVAYVGRLAAVKRPERVLAVARRLPDAHVLVVGDGPLRATLQAAAPAGVRFLGWRRDVEVVYGAADVALLTSDNEGMPVTLVEAALAGVPAVTTDVGSAAEVVLDGLTGLVVPADEEPLARAVEQLLADAAVRHRFGAAARDRARLHFSVERMVAAHRDLYLRA
jgi:glycosyltransferase involved in cell wall biosynthesis